MTLSPLTSAGAIIQVHAFSAIAALLFGLVLLTLKKGTQLHIASGRTWAFLMVVTSLSSFLISQNPIVGPFGFIHILSVLTLAGLGRAIYFARTGNFKAHGRAMMALYFQALILAGLFTFAPGRIMNRVLFSSLEKQGFAMLIFGFAVFVVLLGFVWRKNRAITRS